MQLICSFDGFLKKCVYLLLYAIEIVKFKMYCKMVSCLLYFFRKQYKSELNNKDSQQNKVDKREKNKNTY